MRRKDVFFRPDQPALPSAISIPATARSSWILGLCPSCCRVRGRSYPRLAGARCGPTVPGDLGTSRWLFARRAARPPGRRRQARRARPAAQAGPARRRCARWRPICRPPSWHACGEAVDDEAVVPVMLAEPLLHHGVDEVVADQQPRRHRAPDLRAELGVMLDVPPEDVPDRDVLQVEVPGEHLRVSSLAAALDAHDDVLPHAATLTRNPGRWLLATWPGRCPGRRRRPGAGQSMLPTAGRARPVGAGRAGDKVRGEACLITRLEITFIHG